MKPVAALDLRVIGEADGPTGGGAVLPPPLTPPGCDLQDFTFMPLQVARLRDSALAAEEAPEACWYAVLLWAAAWHQVPAGSLPDNDALLTRLIGLGRDTRTFRKHRAGAMRGFVLCSDGRFYHPVVAEQVVTAWEGKLKQRWGTECARIKKANQRDGTNHPRPSYEEFLSRESPGPSPRFVPQDVPGDTSNCPPGQTIQGKGIGKGTEKESSLRSETRRGSRLATDWQPGEPDRDFAAGKGFSPPGIDRMAEKFRNYWTAKSGSAATKIDWAATWRNWVLEEADRRPPTTSGGRQVDWIG